MTEGNPLSPIPQFFSVIPDSRNRGSRAWTLNAKLMDESSHCPKSQCISFPGKCPIMKPVGPIDIMMPNERRRPGFPGKDVGNDGGRLHRTHPLSSNRSLWHGFPVSDSHPKDSSFQNPQFCMIHFRSIQHEAPLSEADMRDGFSTLFSGKHPEQKRLL